MNFDNKNEYVSENFNQLDMQDVVLESKEFDGCSFRQCNFSDATFKRCNFVDCEFINCNLSNVKMHYSKLSDVVFHESKLVGVDWAKVAWPRLMFCSPVAFTKCILNDSSFYGVSLLDLQLTDCKAHSVDFREGDFSKGDFSYTDFSGSLFSGTDLTEVDFSEAENYDIDIYQNKIKGAKFSRFEAVRLLDCLEIELVD